MEFQKFFLDHQNNFFSQQIRTILITKYHFYVHCARFAATAQKKDQFTDGEKKSSLMSRTVRIGLHFIGGINTTRSNSHGSDIFFLILFSMYLFYKNKFFSYYVFLIEKVNDFCNKIPCFFTARLLKRVFDKEDMKVSV